MKRIAAWLPSRPTADAAWPAVSGWMWLLFAIACSLFLCGSALFFDGQRVDESEVVLNALSIATGDWDPRWSPGYGHLAMYLPAIALAAVAFFLQASGVAATYADGLYLLFMEDSAYRIVRLVYTFADVATALVFANIIATVTRQRLLATAYFLYFMVSPDTWTYANFIRTDTLVSFFTACAIYFLVTARTRFTPYGIGLAVGAAIACKYSAVVYLALAACLILPQEGDNDTFRKRLGGVAIAVTVAVVSALLFQPLYDYSGIFSAIDKHLAGAHFARDPVPMAERMSRLWRLIRTLEPLAPLLLLVMLAGLRKPRQGVPFLLATLLGIAPFILSNFVREYWLIPFADVLRAAGWFGLACVIQWAGVRAGRNTGRVAIAVLGLALVAVAWARMPKLPRPHVQPQQGLSNVEAARRWLYVNAANRVPIFYGYEKNYQLPRAYSFRSYDAAADFSRVFIFQRDDFQQLHDMFERRLYSHEFAEFSSMTRVPALKLSVAMGTNMRINEPPKLCKNEHCFPAQKVACSAHARSQLGECVTYSWDMDRPALRQDLSAMSLQLTPAASEFSLCWYNCSQPKAEGKVALAHGNRIPLLQVADRLFAPARVLGLKQIRKMRGNVGEVYIVTTPAAYKPWLPKKDQAAKGKDGVSKAFAKRMNAKLIRYFDSGSGPRIEVYARRPKKKPKDTPHD